ncbi:hypothetical protein VTN02DRAFT_3800 [Thermoascus thermophilus]
MAILVFTLNCHVSLESNGIRDCTGCLPLVSHESRGQQGSSGAAVESYGVNQPQAETCCLAGVPDDSQRTLGQASATARASRCAAHEALLMGRRIPCDELVAAGFVNRVLAPSSGRPDDSEAFLKLVLAELEDRLGPHLHPSSLLKIKALIRRPEREILDRQNALEAFEGLERFLTGVPQEEFRRLARGEKKHKL